MNTHEIGRTNENLTSIPMSIGITGLAHGAGSSTVAKNLAYNLGYTYLYAGNIFRRVASRYIDPTLTEEDALSELSKRTLGNVAFDTRVDRFVQHGAYEGSCVFEGKTAVPITKAHLFADRNGKLNPIDTKTSIYSFLLTCDPTVCARRALFRDWAKQVGSNVQNMRSDEMQTIMNGFSDELVAAKASKLQKRMESNMARWETQYGLSEIIKNGGGYDLTIDTTYINPDETVNQILLYLTRVNALSPHFGISSPPVLNRLRLNSGM